jgi:hypothetical protein
MQFQIDADIMNEAIRVALRLSPPITGNFTFEVSDNQIHLHSVDALSRCSILIPAACDGEDTTFAIPSVALKDAIAGRKELTFDFDGSLLTIKSGRYKVALSTLDAIALDKEQVTGKPWLVSIEQLTWLKNAVASVYLKPTQNITAFMPVSVQLGEKSSFVACADANHMMFIRSKEVTGDLEFTLPIDTLTAVLDTFNKVQCKMLLTGSALHVKNKLVDVTLALPAQDADSVIGIDMLREKAVEALKVEAESIEVDKKEVQAFLSNSRSVSDKSRSEVQVKCEPGFMILTVKTTLGTAKAKIKADTKLDAEFRIDAEYFEEAVRKSPEKVAIRFAESFLIIKTADAYSLIALNQE